jgi:hypothetical protein
MGCVIIVTVIFLVGLSLEREIKKVAEEMRELNKKMDNFLMSYDRTVYFFQSEINELKEMVGEDNA